ncbi:MAG: type II and III secretion system protein [Verrucomicrobiaceae bacterium]|nr:type II and III secretion system protein [Verrucomicrobiaceae bacterium]
MIPLTCIRKSLFVGLSSIALVLTSLSVRAQDEEAAAPEEAVAAPEEAVAAPEEAVAAPEEAVAAPEEAVAAPEEAAPRPKGSSAETEIARLFENEQIRRLNAVEEAKLSMSDGKRLEEEKDFEGALKKYRFALDNIPRNAPNFTGTRGTASQLFADVSVRLAHQRATEGRFDQARQLIDAVLTDEVNSTHKNAKRLLLRLDDPEWYNHALTPEHVENVAEVDRLLKVGKGYYDLGDFDNAEKQYDAVLRLDRYNTAARRGQQEVEHARRQYHQSSRDHTRSRLLRKVDEAWETQVPLLSVGGRDNLGGDNDSTGREYIARKLKETIIPTIVFDEATVDEAIEYLRQKSKEYDPFETDEAQKGVNIVRRQNAAGPDGAAPAEDQTITLRLTNVPLAEALRYVAEGGGMKYKIEPYTVVVVPLWQGTNDLYTRTFRVPPDFLSSAVGDGGGGGDVVDDPFATGGDGGGTSLKPRQSAKEILMSHGITFPEGASAFFNPRTSTLVARNTQNNMELVEVLVQELLKQVQNQVYITTKFVEITQRNYDELGFDWMLGQFNVADSNRVFASGGTNGNARAATNAQDYSFVPPGGGENPVPTGQFPVTSGLRFGTDAVQNNAIDGLLNQQILTSTLSPGIFGVGGVLTDPQFQVVIRALQQRKGTDLMTAPSVVTRSGQRAKIEIIREFIYPTEFDPPEIPQDFGGGNNFGGGGFGGGGFAGLQPNFGQAPNSFPVTPANPTAFEMRPVGVTLEVDPVVGADGFTIELNVAPEVVEFEGFINYGSPIQTGAVDALGQPTTVVLTENRITQPVFSTRKLTTAVTIWDGQTVAIGGLIREDVQHVEDKVPLFGDIPLVGRFFRTTSENHFKKNLMIFVTARLIDPAGQPINQNQGGAEPAATGVGTAVGGGPSDSLFGN